MNSGQLLTVPPRLLLGRGVEGSCPPSTGGPRDDAGGVGKDRTALDKLAHP